ncbi:hypothetical protein NC797_17915 [Aquibacillus sp. 3ASR75-11]|uniref:Peptidase M1 membrane alanine aminopeptidase domain-containing protein n=1 Tax=Terrihalobacillus insolitus TaxID=2950438 RepID=A0A9X3WVC5_9BACI|nr:M1 family aminopeptidase [Terrihalobacillus insolitus]MDC3414518.1 hypothetical protein [Terrihalobacillus insolitus]MDC3426345.1 hypothetical protein [Terrihalobacillus insolitus]
MKPQRTKMILAICMMTLFYTTALLFAIPELQLQSLLNNTLTTIGDKATDLASGLTNAKQTQSREIVSSTSDGDTMQQNNEKLPTYYIRADLDEENYQIDGEVKVTIDNPKTDSILFYTYPYSWSPMRIKKVLLNEQEVPFSYNQKQLSIKNRKAQKELTIHIEFETPVPQKGTRFGFKDDIWLITTWYPMLGVLDDNKNWADRPDPIGMGDPFLFNFANYIVEWTSSPSINWLSSGTLVSDTIRNNRRTTTWQVNSVRNFALAGSKNYQVKRLELDKNTTISIASTEEKNLEQLTDISQASYSLFETRYGQLPYTNISVIETGYNTNFALEYPNLAIFSKDLYADNQIEHWLPHEIGHMWWYNAVGVNEVQNGWIDEGLAELSVVLYLEDQFSKSEKGEQLRTTYRERNRSLTNTSPQQRMDVGLYGFKSRSELYDSWYARSADMFLTLREEIGEDDFNYFLKTLYLTNRGKTIDETSIIKALDKSLSVKTDLFENWINEPYQQTKWNVEVMDK